MDSAKKILLIEDDSTIRSVLSHVLSKNGYEVMTCMLLREATGLLNSHTFDLIICDVGLPDGNGLDFCSKYQQIPFISMSASENTVMLEKPVANTQIYMIVDGCKVKLNFPPKSEGTAISDVKRMMLGDTLKT